MEENKFTPLNLGSVGLVSISNRYKTLVCINLVSPPFNIITMPSFARQTQAYLRKWDCVVSHKVKEFCWGSSYLTCVKLNMKRIFLHLNPSHLLVTNAHAMLKSSLISSIRQVAKSDWSVALFSVNGDWRQFYRQNSLVKNYSAIVHSSDPQELLIYLICLRIYPHFCIWGPIITTFLTLNWISFTLDDRRYYS